MSAERKLTDSCHITSQNTPTLKGGKGIKRGDKKSILIQNVRVSQVFQKKHQAFRLSHQKGKSLGYSGNNLKTESKKLNNLDEPFKKGEMWPIKYENPVKWRQLSNAIIKPKSFSGTQFWQNLDEFNSNQKMQEAMFKK